MKLYGCLGFYHHSWARVLTVMSPSGVSATLATIEPGDDVSLKRDANALPRFVERRAGGLQRLIDTYAIEVLEASEWSRMKAALGQRILD